MPVRRLPLTFRALLLVPLLAVGVDQARATLACGPRAESCLQAAGQGWLGGAGIVLVALYAIALALGVGRLARGSAAAAGRTPGLLRLWSLGTLGVAAVCGGQALLAGALGAGGALGGGWVELALLCVLAGGALALALRAAPAAAALMRSLRPTAPRLRLVAAAPLRIPAPPARRRRLLAALAAPGRAPPAPLA
jgi:hypothetical protein